MPTQGLPGNIYIYVYIGDSGKSFGDRLKEHFRAPSPIHHHSHTTGHLVNFVCFNIGDRVTRGCQDHKGSYVPLG